MLYKDGKGEKSGMQGSGAKLILHRNDNQFPTALYL